MAIPSVPLYLCTPPPTPFLQALHPPHPAHKLQCLLLLDICVSLTENELQLSQAVQGRSLTVISPQPGSKQGSTLLTLTDQPLCYMQYLLQAFLLEHIHLLSHPV